MLSESFSLGLHEFVFSLNQCDWPRSVVDEWTTSQNNVCFEIQKYLKERLIKMFGKHIT